MPLTYWINRTPHAVFIRYNKNPRFEEWADAMNSVLHHPDYECGSDFLLDRRFVEDAPTTKYVESKVAFIKEHESMFCKSRWAVVVMNPANYGMERMAQTLSQGTSVDLRVFVDMKEAQQWLNSAQGLP